MSASGPPLCRICQKEHWMRDPHILPANAPAEKRSNRAATTNVADTNCRTLRTDLRASKGAPGTGRRGMNGQREVSRQGIVRPTNTSADEAKGRKAGNARRNSSADCSSSRFTAQTGGTPVKNTSMEGRDVLKGAKPTSTASTERPNPPPATPGKPAGKNRQSRAAKPAPGKRKPRTKKG